MALISGVIGVAAIGFAGPAEAAPTGELSAADTVKSLQDEGYSVQVNGTANVPLSECLVTGLHGLSNPAPRGTVYVDVSCPSDN